MAARGEMANPTLHRNMEAMNIYGSIAQANIDTPGCIGVRNQDGNAIQLCCQESGLLVPSIYKLTLNTSALQGHPDS